MAAQPGRFNEEVLYLEIEDLMHWAVSIGLSTKANLTKSTLVAKKVLPH